ncbi:MAG: PTS transporter subunit EIIC [Erysipelotrichaceae bacterium]|nr:PTS transporter subunit EIIC [Erysipelotrichaceae bacterium]MDY5251564.1 PTS transporter subunit EIIC [Erysipelotrichaceae bacterium]
MKKDLNILLVCVAGASTSLLANKMQQALNSDENWRIEARTVGELEFIIGKYDYVLVAPQIKYNLQHVEEVAKQYEGIKVFAINPKDFASINGENVVNMIRETLINSKYLNEGKGEVKMSEKQSFMDKLSGWMEKYIVPVGQKISNQRHLAAVRDGLTIMIPATIIGGIACLIAVPPVPATITEPSNIFYAFLLAWKSFAAANSAVLMLPYQLTIGIISIYVVCGVSYQLAKTYNMNGINNMITSLLVYLCVSGSLDMATGSIVIAKLGAGYMFSAMVVGLLVVEINHFFIKKNIVIKLPASVPPNVAAPFNVLIPGIFNVIFFIVLNVVITSVTGAGLSDLVYTIFQPLMSATGSLPSVLLINLLMTTFWFFGIHGANMLSVVTSPITTAALAANAEAYVAGQSMPYIYAGAMNSVFGNWITYNVILLVIFLFCKSSQTRSVAKVAIVPSLFNINEPSIFGLPTVLNIYTYIPLVICSMINCSSYYLLASANLVGRFYISLPFTVPGPLQAFLATGDVKTVLLWIALFIIDIPIVYPFIKTYDKQLVEQEKLEG